MRKIRFILLGMFLSFIGILSPKALYNEYDYYIDTYNIMNFKVVQLYQEIELLGQILDKGEEFIRLEIVLNIHGEAYSKATFLIQHFNEK